MIPDPNNPGLYIFEDYFSFIDTFYGSLVVVNSEPKVKPEVKDESNK